jgi:hypothetical protein
MSKMVNKNLVLDIEFFVNVEYCDYYLLRPVMPISIEALFKIFVKPSFSSDNFQ